MSDTGLIINILCAIVGGLCLGFILYGIFKRPYRGVIKGATFFLLVSIAVFVYVNFDYIGAGTIKIPAMNPVYGTVISEFEAYVNNAEGVLKIDYDNDNNMIVKVTAKSYEGVKRGFIGIMLKSIEQLEEDERICVSGIEKNSDFTDFTVNIIRELPGNEIEKCEKFLDTMSITYHFMLEDIDTLDVTFRLFDEIKGETVYENTNNFIIKEEQSAEASAEP